MLNDVRVASLGFFKDNVCTTRIHREKKFKIKFQVHLKFAQIPPDYFVSIWLVGLFKKLVDSNINVKCFQIVFDMYKGIKPCVS